MDSCPAETRRKSSSRGRQKQKDSSLHSQTTSCRGTGLLAEKSKKQGENGGERTRIIWIGSKKVARASPTQTVKSPVTVHTVRSGCVVPSSAVLYRSAGRSGRTFSRKPETGVGGFVGVRTAATPASDHPGPPKTLISRQCAFPPGASCPHSCRCRAAAPH